MIKRSITHLATADPARELDPERRKALRKHFNPLAARRFTDLPLLIGEVTDSCVCESQDEWIYASRFGCTQSLERYLKSFPTPSPLHFQNSIHPGAFDLVSVARRGRSGQLNALCGLDGIVAEALLSALITPADTVVHLVGGEEYEPWSSGHGWGGEESFAFYLRLEAGAVANALGEVTFTPLYESDSEQVSSESQAGDSVPDLLDLHAGLQQRKPLTFRAPERGIYRLTWT